MYLPNTSKQNKNKTATTYKTFEKGREIERKREGRTYFEYGIER